MVAVLTALPSDGKRCGGGLRVRASIGGGAREHCFADRLAATRYYQAQGYDVRWA